MPYISKLDRVKFEKVLSVLGKLPYLPIGELNYLITSIIDQQIGSKPNYQKYNDMIGVLECIKLELYRRQTAPYEDYKKNNNGDVYENREYWKRIEP